MLQLYVKKKELATGWHFTTPLSCCFEHAKCGTDDAAEPITASTGQMLAVPPADHMNVSNRTVVVLTVMSRTSLHTFTGRCTENDTGVNLASALCSAASAAAHLALRVAILFFLRSLTYGSIRAHGASAAMQHACARHATKAKTPNVCCDRSSLTHPRDQGRFVAP